MFLDHIVSVGCREAADHDRSTGRRARGRRKEVCTVERRSGRGRQGERLAGILARVLAVLLEGVPGECDGTGGL